MADALIRYFCMVLPNGGAQLGFDYLEAFDKTGLGVRACPIGPAFLMSGGWPKLTPLFFIGQNAKRYVNVVCAPPGLFMGHVLRAIDVKPPPDVLKSSLVSSEDTNPDAKDIERIIYDPQTALSGLFTVGVPNIAVTMPKPKLPDEKETSVLRRYDAVLCPTVEDANALRQLGIIAFQMPPEPTLLARVVDWVMRKPEE